ncbi:hypothetical protein C8Q70DRAFT_1054611 [Cubamyces menziesii]|nr:hypothetical protein C8Q70DRAFT_1054611 [Cubamyces menziesii]
MQQPVVFTVHCLQGFGHGTANLPLPPSVCDPSLFLDAPTTTSLSSPTSLLRHDERPEWDGLSSGSSSPGSGPSAYHAGVHSSHIGANNLRYRRGDELGGIRIGGERMRAIASHSEAHPHPMSTIPTPLAPQHPAALSGPSGLAFSPDAYNDLSWSHFTTTHDSVPHPLSASSPAFIRTPAQSYPPFSLSPPSPPLLGNGTVDPRDIFGDQALAEAHEDILPQTQPITEPSRLPKGRVQPKRAAKRKLEGQENNASDTSTSRPQRKQRMSKASAAVTSGPAPAPNRRRTKAELENALVPVERTRCGLEGCEHMLDGSQTKARKHARSHYPEAPSQEPKAGSAKSPSPADTVSSEGTGDDKKPIVCTYEHKDHPGKRCGMRFKNVLGLSKHLEFTHYGWTFPCPKCGGSYSRRDVLVNHSKKCAGKHQTPPGE